MIHLRVPLNFEAKFLVEISIEVLPQKDAGRQTDWRGFRIVDDVTDSAVVWCAVDLVQSGVGVLRRDQFEAVWSDEIVPGMETENMKPLMLRTVHIILWSIMYNWQERF